MSPQFPILSQYTYLNTARYCALPKTVVEMQQAFLTHVSTHGSWEFEQWSGRYENARLMSAALVGCKKDQLFFLPNVSLGYNLSAQYLPKRKVVCLKGDFPSVHITWEPHGFDVMYLDYKAVDFYDRLEKTLSEPRQILSASWIQSADGFELNLEFVFDLCKRKNHYLVLDGTQGLGAIPLNIDPSVSCIFLASGFKWLMAGYGIALGYISEDLLPHLKPMRGWNSGFDSSGHIQSGAASLEVGNATYLNAAALNEGLQIISELGVQNILKENAALTEYLKKKLTSAERKFQDFDSRSSIVSFAATEAEYQRLAAAKIQTSIQKDAIRVSPHFYNTLKDIDRLIKILG